jgi:hypothetical protein
MRPTRIGWKSFDEDIWEVVGSYSGGLERAVHRRPHRTFIASYVDSRARLDLHFSPKESGRRPGRSKKASLRQIITANGKKATVTHPGQRPPWQSSFAATRLPPRPFRQSWGGQPRSYTRSLTLVCAFQLGNSDLDYGTQARIHSTTRVVDPSNTYCGRKGHYIWAFIYRGRGYVCRIVLPRKYSSTPPTNKANYSRWWSGWATNARAPDHRERKISDGH